MNKPTGQEVVLALESGFVTEAIGHGTFENPRGGEFVFCTSMCGIEESLTDPSFAEQVLVSTVSHVGNTGFTSQDMESGHLWAQGLVCRNLTAEPSSWRAKTSLLDWIMSEEKFVLEQIDTRALTIHLRTNGSQRGLVFKKSDFQKLAPSEIKKIIAQRVPDMQGRDLTEKVSCDRPYEFWSEGEEASQIAVWDFGVKTNTLALLKKFGCNVHVLPAKAKADELLKAGTHGILLSNGPGDPASATHIIEELKKILGRRETYAICLGHQLMALAAGAKTHKMKFGHRGSHHPVVEYSRQGDAIHTWITSQNHGFCVEATKLPPNSWVRFRHGNDESVEGVEYPEWMASSVQFHPEAAPGPHDSIHLIKEFVEKVQNKRRMS